MADIHAAVTKSLGYLLTDSQLSTDYTERALTVSKDAVQRAKNVYDSFLKSAGWPSANGEMIPEGYQGTADPSASWAPSASGITSYPMRIADASYYYALEFIAEEYSRIRIGNVGSQPGGSIQQTILAKAQTLLAIAKDGIMRYEQWCEKEAGVMGANSMQLIADAVTAGFDGFEQTRAIWETAVSDNDELDNIYSLPLAYQDRIRQAAYGYSLRLVATKLAQRSLGYSGARLPTIAQYYSQQATQLMQIGEKLVEEFGAWVVDTKQVLLSVKAYKQRDNAYGVVSIIAGIAPSRSESIFRVRSLVTGMPAAFDHDSQDIYLVLYQLASNGATAWWYNRSTKVFTMPVEVIPGDVLTVASATAVACPDAGVYKGELVVMQKGTDTQVGSFEVFINVENPSFTAFGSAFTLRTMRQIVDAEIATSPNKAKNAQLDFDDALLCRAAFNACDDWNTLMPDFPRKVQPASYSETSLFRQGIVAHAFMIKGTSLARSSMGVADTKAPAVHAFEQRKAEQFMNLGQQLVKMYRDDVIRTQRRIWNHGMLR